MAANAVPECTPAEAWARMQAGALLVDVRETAELQAGQVPGARSQPLSAFDPAALPRDRPILCLCLSGRRSQVAAERLRAAAHPAAVSVAGGFRAWLADGLPVAGETEGPLSRSERERYARQLLLPEFGVAGQQRLKSARVLLVGAGGLGSPAALYLAAAGVGHLRIHDPDRVERSNLHRQVLHGEADVGRWKVTSAADRLRALNPDISVEAIASALDAHSLGSALEGVDVVVDGSDNLGTRYRVDAACRRAGIPWVYAAVERFQGQLSVFWPTAAGGPWPCYRCLYPDAPDLAAAPSCAEVGVLGVVPGLLGVLQASEALKLLLGLGQPLLGRLLCMDVLGQHWRTLTLPVDPDCECQRG